MNPSPIRLKRLLWAGPATVMASVAAVWLVRTIAVAVLHPTPRFLPLTIGAPMFDTVVAGTIAILVFRGICVYGSDPVREYRSLAAKVLIVSFGPDIALALGHWFGGGWPEAFALMAMHVIVWVLCVTMLPALVVQRNP